MNRLTPDVIDAMSDAEYKVVEDRFRRMARRQGLVLTKRRRYDPRATDYCTYTLINGAGHVVGGPGLGLDDVERILLDDPELSGVA